MQIKKTLIGAIEKFKEVKEKNDEDLSREAILSLENLSKHAAEIGDSSVATLIPHLIAELNKIGSDIKPFDNEVSD